jgi:hypothetical protein
MIIDFFIFSSLSERILEGLESPGLIGPIIQAPNRADRVLSRAGHKQFEVVLHGLTSWIEVEWLVGIPATDGTTKNVLCQEKLLF